MQPIGLYALCYSLAALLVFGSKQIAYGGHPLTHFILTLGGGLVTAIVLTLHGWLRPPGEMLRIDATLVLPPVGWSPGPLFLSALLTALVAPAVLWLLNKLRPVFGFRASRSQRF